MQKDGYTDIMKEVTQKAFTLLEALQRLYKAQDSLLAAKYASADVEVKKILDGELADIEENIICLRQELRIEVNRQLNKL